MEKETRNAIERATQRARGILVKDFAEQLQGDYDVMQDGRVGERPGAHLTGVQRALRSRIVASIEHKRAQGMKPNQAVADYLRDAAFTTLNRFVALKMLEARGLVQECVSRGDASSGFVNEFCGLAPGLKLPDRSGYRLYIESIFDELSTEVKVLFDRRDPASALWPRKAAFDGLLASLNVAELEGVWGEDETIGWVYQFFNGQEERRKMREESQAPRNSRELAVRNQFFTPRYVVQFLTDNTLGRIWYEMRGANTVLAERCEFMVRKLGEEFAPRPKKDPRDLRVLDPACGSGHFLLYAFDLLLRIYEEAYTDPSNPKSEVTGHALAEDYSTLNALRAAVPGLILAHNLHGVDIDPRCAQIAQLALWMRAQRAYREFEIDRGQRPPIRRSNIVVAEPPVADEQVAKEFVVKLGDAELGRVFVSLIESLNFAGDMGPLLRVERAFGRHVGQGLGADLFRPTDERIRAALDDFIRETQGAMNPRRRLFVDDAAHGLALLSVAEKKFDVVLMNPPFGLPTERAKEHLRHQYPNSWTDLFNAFLTRAHELSNSRWACVGAIIPDRLLVSKKSSSVRQLLLSKMPLSTLVDIGPDVMDGAAVNAVMLTTNHNVHSLKVHAKPREPNEVDRALSLQRWANNPGVPTDFAGAGLVPGAPISLGEASLEAALWTRSARLQPDLATVATGGKTFDDFRFLRAWWEVDFAELGRSWLPVDVGGDYKPALAVPKMVQKWFGEGKEIRVKAVIERGTDAQVLQSSKFWFKRGIAYPYTSSIGFGPRLFFDDAILSTDAVAVFPHNPNDIFWILGVLLSTHTEKALATFGSGRKTENGSVKVLPISRPDDTQLLTLRVVRLMSIALQTELNDETSRAFARPLALLPDTLVAEIDEIGMKIDDLSASAFGKNPTSDGPPILSQRAGRWLNLVVPRLHNEVSYLIGYLFGRWSVNISQVETEIEKIVSVSALSVLALGNENSSTGTILVNDEGHEHDIVFMLVKAARDIQNANIDAESRLTEISTDQTARLRDYVAHDFFSDHLKRYSIGGRQAPIYWQLAVPSASYSVWLYVHAFTKDTLFRVQNEYVATKLGHEERRLKSLKSERGDGGTTAQRKELAAQEVFVEELRTFLEEVKRVAPLWNPNFDDGVIINFAPLWRLVPQHKAWQKELKATWDALCEGKYDWTHLAMHLWPDRVVPKCAGDRSLAIGHGLEDAFWEEDAAGIWKERETLIWSIEEVIAKRSSAAVKAALKNLIEAPDMGGSTKRGRKSKAA